jgi:DNA-binding NtrC family response regulator
MTPQEELILIESIKAIEQSFGSSSPEIKQIFRLQGHKISYSPYTNSWLDKFITQDQEMLAAKERIRKLAHCKYNHIPVLIRGPTGTGKELLANALHGNRVGNFVAINCTSLPDTLVESELFGHKKGSFTSSDSDRVGAFEHANNGTLFLDEIGDMGPMMQAKLLRVLENGKYRRLGENEERYSNARIVTATNKNLLAPNNTFREDLYWRLSCVVIHTTSLADRQEDILLIAEKVFKYKLPEKGFPLCSRGNVRELRNWIINKQIEKGIV